MGRLYTFDKDSASVKRVRRSVRGVLWSVCKWVVATVSLAAFYYIVFSFVIDTDSERRLKNENRMYEKLYPELKEKSRLLSDVVDDLRMRDDKIYEQIFHTQAPAFDVGGLTDFLSESDTIPDRLIVDFTEKKAEGLAGTASRVEENFKEIFGALAGRRTDLPPLCSPIEEITFAHAGASVGRKISPFYKVLSEHSGLDILAGNGTPVHASAPGIVSNVARSNKGSGNSVEIDHGNGYFTRYAHLDNVMVVKGQTIDTGKIIGNVGMTGNSFAPHLHYEVLRDSVYMDPVNYLFATLSPEQYAGVAFVSTNTGQSLD